MKVHKSLAIISVLAINGCGDASQPIGEAEPIGKAQQPITTTTLYNYLNDSVSNISGRAYAEAAHPISAQVHASTFGMGTNAVSNAISNWNLGTYTTVTTPANWYSYQRGGTNYSTTKAPSVALHTYYFHCVNKTSLQARDYNSGNAMYPCCQATVRWSTTDNKRPFYNGGRYRASFQLKVPDRNTDANSFTYAQTCSRFQDPVTGKFISICLQAYNTLGAQPDIVQPEYADSAAANTRFGGPGTYASSYGSSQSFQTSVWSTWKYFEYTITPSQMLAAINAVNALRGWTMSTNTANYMLRVFTVENEVNWPEGSNAYQAMAVYAIKVQSDTGY